MTLNFKATLSLSPELLKIANSVQIRIDFGRAIYSVARGYSDTLINATYGRNYQMIAARIDDLLLVCTLKVHETDNPI